MLAVAVYWFLSVVGVFEPSAVVGTPPPASAAARAGLLSGDTVVEVAGSPVRSWNELRWLLLQRAVSKEPIDIEVEGSDKRRADLATDADSPEDLDGDLVGRLGFVLYQGPTRIGQVSEASPAAQAACGPVTASYPSMANRLQRQIDCARLFAPRRRSRSRSVSSAKKG